MSESTPTPAHTCPECGAIIEDGVTCWDKLCHLLAWEVDDPALAAIHFVTVSSYNVQHPANFNAAGHAALRAALIAYLDEGASPHELRRFMSAQFEGSSRVLRPIAERKTVLRSCALTIEYAYDGGNPAGAATRVREWAAAIRRELDAEEL